MEKVQKLIKNTTESVSNVVNNVANTFSNLTTSSLGNNSSQVLSKTSNMVENVSDTIQSSLTSILNMNNENKIILATIAVVALLVFCGKVSLKIPSVILNVMNNSNVRMISIFSIAYLATQDHVMALIATIALMLIFNKIAIYKNNKKIVKALKDNELKNLDSTESSTNSSNNIEPLYQKDDVLLDNDANTEPQTNPVSVPDSKPITDTATDVSGYGGDDYATL